MSQNDKRLHNNLYYNSQDSQSQFKLKQRRSTSGIEKCRVPLDLTEKQKHDLQLISSQDYYEKTQNNPFQSYLDYKKSKAQLKKSQSASTVSKFKSGKKLCLTSNNNSVLNLQNLGQINIKSKSNLEEQPYIQKGVYDIFNRKQKAQQDGKFINESKERIKNEIESIKNVVLNCNSVQSLYAYNRQAIRRFNRGLNGGRSSTQLAVLDHDIFELYNLKNELPPQKYNNQDQTVQQSSKTTQRPKEQQNSSQRTSDLGNTIQTTKVIATKINKQSSSAVIIQKPQTKLNGKIVLVPEEKFIDSILKFKSTTPQRWKDFWQDTFNIRPKELSSIYNDYKQNESLTLKEQARVFRAKQVKAANQQYINKPRPKPKSQFKVHFNEIKTTVSSLETLNSQVVKGLNEIKDELVYYRTIKRDKQNENQVDDLHEKVESQPLLQENKNVFKEMSLMQLQVGLDQRLFKTLHVKQRKGTVKWQQNELEIAAHLKSLVLKRKF